MWCPLLESPSKVAQMTSKENYPAIVTYGGGRSRVQEFLRSYGRVYIHLLKVVFLFPFSSHGREAVRKLGSLVLQDSSLRPLSFATVSLDSLVPSLGALTVELPRAASIRFRNVAVHERAMLAALIKARNLQKVFEFGTYNGLTTLTLAMANPLAEVVTIDLEPRIQYADEAGESEIAIGCLYKGTPEERRITQLFGNSLSFQFENLSGQFDLVFIDAKHTYTNVSSDTKTALTLLNKDQEAWIVWHDVTTALGVREFLEERCKAGHSIFHIEGTTMAIEKLGPQLKVNLSRV